MEFRYDDCVIRITHPDRAALLTAVQARLGQAAGAGPGAGSGAGFALATLNLDHLVKLDRDPGFRSAYAAQDMVVADGNPVVWLSRLAGRPVALVPGADMVVPLARVAAAAGVSVALVGSTAAALERAGQTLRAAVPGLAIAASEAPPFGFDPDSPEATALLQRIAASGARLCFLALGAPKQERLAARGRQIAPGVGFASIGAGLDFLAGAQQRAPQWVRRLALEWLWRMLSSPARMVPRYAACARILPGHVRAARALRRR